MSSTDASARRSFEIVEHMADWSIRVWGRDLAELFAHAAEGMAHLLVGDRTVPQDRTIAITLEAYDSVDLLVAWLTELAFYAEQDGVVMTRVENLRVIPTALQATVIGGAADMLKHIKAVTYHNLAIIEIDGGLEATIVFDV